MNKSQMKEGTNRNIGKKTDSQSWQAKNQTFENQTDFGIFQPTRVVLCSQSDWRFLNCSDVSPKLFKTSDVLTTWPFYSTTRTRENEE